MSSINYKVYSALLLAGSTTLSPLKADITGTEDDAHISSPVIAGGVGIIPAPAYHSPEELSGVDSRLQAIATAQAELQDELKAGKARKAELQKQLEEANADSIIRKGSFADQLTAEKMTQAAALSALIYQVSHNGKINCDSAEAKTIQHRIDAIAKRIAALSEIDTVNDSKKSVTKSLKKLGCNTDELNDQDFSGSADNLRLAKLAELEHEHAVETARYKNLQDSMSEAMQRILDGRSEFAGLKVVGCFTRNSGQFSGAVVYNKETGELFVAAAGSNSKLDWIKNAFGWSAKSMREGLQGLKMHAGFLSHFNSLDDSSFVMSQKLLEKLKEDIDSGESKPLKIVGVGHSLGGAISQIMTAHLAQVARAAGIKVSVGGVSFGAPNLLHSDSVSAFNEILGGADNWVNVRRDWDPVPGLSAMVMKKHAGIVLNTNFGLLHDANGSFTWLPVNGHSSEGYYHEAKVAFKNWRTGVDSYQSAVSELAHLEARMDAIPAELRKSATEASELMTAKLNVANRETLSEYNAYLTSEEAEARATAAEVEAKMTELRQDAEAMVAHSVQVAAMNDPIAALIALNERGVDEDAITANAKARADAAAIAAEAEVRLAKIQEEKAKTADSARGFFARLGAVLGLSS